MINEKATSDTLVASSYRKSCTGSAHSSPSFGGIEGGLHLGNTVVMFEDKSGDNTVTNDEVIQRYYYYPFGAETKNAPWTQQPTPTIRYQYNGKEKIDELGLGWNDYGARNYDALLGRWMGVDALAEKYMGYSGYNYVLGNPISLIDPDGMQVEDIVYFNTTGKEIHRVKSDTEFKTYVANENRVGSIDAQLHTNGVQQNNFTEAAMPSVVYHSDGSGSAAKYQDYDYQIAASTALFNRGKSDGSASLFTDGGTAIPKFDVANIPNLDPTLVKSIAMQESHVGTDSRGHGTSDIMQVNNGMSDFQDWKQYKTNYGLFKGEIPSPFLSISAGINNLATKGFRGGVTYNKDTGNQTFTFQGWRSATANYNGGGVPNYKAYNIFLNAQKQ